MRGLVHTCEECGMLLVAPVTACGRCNKAVDKEHIEPFTVKTKSTPAKQAANRMFQLMQGGSGKGTPSYYISEGSIKDAQLIVHKVMLIIGMFTLSLVLMGAFFVFRHWLFGV